MTLIGRNGAGKTTTLRSIMGIARTRHGRIVLAVEEIRGGRPTRSSAGASPGAGERRVLPNLTVLENLRLACNAGVAMGRRASRRCFEMFPRLRERTPRRAASLGRRAGRCSPSRAGLVARRSSCSRRADEGLARYSSSRSPRSCAGSPDGTTSARRADSRSPWRSRTASTAWTRAAPVQWHPRTARPRPDDPSSASWSV